MWNICKITEDLYCFTKNSTSCEEPIAIVQIKVDNNSQLAMQIEVCMTYLNRNEEYNELLVELRYFAKSMKQLRDKQEGFMNIHCQGISNFVEDSIPSVQDSKGLVLIDTTFYEDII